MDPKPLLAYHTWISLPQDTRHKLVTLFQIPRTGQVLVTTGVLPDGTIGGMQQQDGHAPVDLYAITVEKMQTVLNNEDEKDFYVLWNGVIENLEEIMPSIQMEDPVEPEPAAPPVEEPKPTDTFIPRDPEELLKKAEAELVDNQTEVESIELVDVKIITKPTEHAKTKKGRPAKAK